MEVATFAVLFGCASALALVAAVSSDRMALIPSGGLFVVLGMLLFVSPLVVQDGHEYTYTQQNNDTVRADRTATFSEVSAPSTNLDVSNLVGLTTAFTGVYFLVISFSRMGFRQYFRRARRQ